MRVVGVHRENPIIGLRALQRRAEAGVERPMEAAVSVVPHDFDAHFRTVAPLGHRRGLVLAAIVHDDDANRFGEARLRLTHPLQKMRQGFGFVICGQSGDDHAPAPSGVRRTTQRSCAATARPAEKITMNKYIARINR